MDDNHKEIALELGGLFKPGMHICLFYRNEQERQQVMSKYIQSGLTNNEKIGYFSDIMSPQELKNWLEEMGIHIPQKDKKKQIEIFTPKEVYYPEGKFDPDKMLANYKNYYNSAIAAGFSGARITGETSWINKTIPGVDRFIEYEARVNEILKKYPVTTMCQYDVRLFDGGTIFDVLQVHPLMIVHGQVVKNPAYIKPKEFLKILHSRENE